MQHELKVSQRITPREGRSLTRYLNEISKVSLLTPDEEAALAKRVKRGDSDALNKLISSNLRFVVSVAKQYRDSYLSLNDLINEGNCGLILAAQKFDETRGFKFISYAIWWIRQSILKAISEQSRLIRLPLNKVTHLNKLKKATSALEQRLLREPTSDELSDELNLKTEEIDAAIRYAPQHLSINESVAEDEATEVYEVLPDKETAHPAREMEYSDSLRIDTERILSKMPRKHKDILELYYGFRNGQVNTLDDIAQQLGGQRERIRQIKEKALHSIRISPRERVLKEYLCQ